MHRAVLLGHHAERTITLEQALRREGVRSAVAASVGDLADLADSHGTAVLVIDRVDGRAGDVEAVVERWEGGVVVIGGEGGVPWPLEPGRLAGALRSVLGTESPDGLEDGARDLPDIIGRSAALMRVVDTIRQTAPTRSTILLQGESGTGKEVLARAVHGLSPRAKGPFIAVNCAAMPDGLVESTLFGHERGAFTGATEQFPGAFERADGGTLLLDEVSEMDLGLQAKLLRAIQEMAFERVGGRDLVEVDIRIVATTNRDLAAAVDEGTFREDLYYRLSVIPVLVPPLRDRREDVPILVEHFLAQFAERMGRDVQSVGPRAMEMLMGHGWPGNVRELSHVVERAVALTDEPVLDADDFIPEKRGIAPWRKAPVRGPTAPVVAQLSGYDLKDAEAVLIEAALDQTGGNRTRAADLLGISPRTLRNKLNRPSEDGA